MAEHTYWERFSDGDPYRERWRHKQLNLVNAMKVLASGQLLDSERDGEELCSCTEWVIELATMVEVLHKLIDEKVPGALRHDVA